MKKVELKIMGLSYSPTQAGAYILVLGANKGSLRIPVIIKGPEAQYIALKLEDIKSPRILMPDLTFNAMSNFGILLDQTWITHILEGIYHTKLIFSNVSGDEHQVESTIGDAICLALAFDAPIYCNQEVINISGIEVDEDGNVAERDQPTNYTQVATVENLEKMLEKAIENEEYEIASQIRDRIIELKKQNQE